MTEKNCTNCNHSICVCGGWWCYYEDAAEVTPYYCCEYWEAME